MSLPMNGFMCLIVKQSVNLIWKWFSQGGRFRMSHLKKRKPQQNNTRSTKKVSIFILQTEYLGEQ